MSTPAPAARSGSEPPELVCKRTDGDGGSEVTFFESDIDPADRMTRWITALESDCVLRDELR